MNINGKNGLACITPLSTVIKRNKLELRPLPGLPVIRDLVVDMTEFYAQYDKIKPFLQKDSIILFDELYNFFGWREGEFKALLEVFSDNEFNYIAFTNSQQVTIQIL